MVKNKMKKIIQNSFRKVKEDLTNFMEWTGSWISFLDADNRKLNNKLNRLENRLYIIETYLNSRYQLEKSEDMKAEVPYYR